MAEVLDEDGKVLFQVTAAGAGTVDWRDVAGKHRRLAEQSRIPGHYSEIEIAQRFGVAIRVVRDRARAKGLERKIGGVRWFTEAEATIGLWEGSKPCQSNSIKGALRPTSTRAARTSESEFSKALELATGGKRKGSSTNSGATSSKTPSVVPFPSPKPSRARR
jgi:hypothetical protein